MITDEMKAALKRRIEELEAMPPSSLSTQFLIKAKQIQSRIESGGTTRADMRELDDLVRHYNE